MKLSDCKVGDIVTFSYHNLDRKVKVERVHLTGGANKGITGEDLVNGGTKRFLDYKASNVGVVVTKRVVTKTVRFDKMQDMVKDIVGRMTPEELIAAYSGNNPDVIGASYNSAYGQFELDEVAKESHCVNETLEGLAITVVNKNGDDVVVYIDKNNTLHVYAGGGDTEQVNIVGFVEFLKSHLDK